MTPYNCYRSWMAIKTHLTDLNYDIVKYQGKTKHTDVDAYENSPHRHHFVRLSNHYSPHWLMLSVLLDNDAAWIGDTRGDRAEELCTERMKNAEALTYHFTQEIGTLSRDIPSLIRYERGRHPPLMRSYLGKRISLETLTVLGAITNFPRIWLKLGGHDMMVEQVARRALKYASFLNIDEDKFRKIVVESVTNRD